MIFGFGGLLGSVDPRLDLAAIRKLRLKQTYRKIKKSSGLEGWSCRWHAKRTKNSHAQPVSRKPDPYSRTHLFFSYINYSPCVQ